MRHPGHKGEPGPAHGRDSEGGSGSPEVLSVTVGPVFCLSLWEERVSPALGMTWSNQLLMRLMVSRRRPEEEAVLPPPGRPDRTLRVIFAPHLPPSSCSYTVSMEGVRGTPGTEAR